VRSTLSSRNYRHGGKFSNPVTSQRDDHGRRPSIETVIKIVVAPDGVCAKHDEISLRTCLSQMRLDIGWHLTPQEMSPPHDEERTVMLGQYLVLDYLRIPLISMAQVTGQCLREF